MRSTLTRSLAVVSLMALPALGGCVLGEMIAAPLANADRDATVEVKAEYKGLAGKSFAVVVMSDRAIGADYPELAPRLCNLISDRLAKNSGASHMLPPQAVMDYVLNNPRWVAMGYGDLAKALGVDRVVLVELIGYRLQDPGNQYVWAGQASAAVRVIEADTALADEAAYSKTIKVGYPDKDGYTPNDMSRMLVHSELTRRLSDRAAWLMYTHEEPKRLPY
jgi:hypothetical protein